MAASSSEIEDDIDEMLHWLDKTERKTHQMVRGTLINVQQEPLLEYIQEQRVRKQGRQ